MPFDGQVQARVSQDDPRELGQFDVRVRFQVVLAESQSAYEKMLLDIAVFCSEWRFVLVLPIVGLGLLFAIAEVAGRKRVGGLRRTPWGLDEARGRTPSSAVGNPVDA